MITLRVMGVAVLLCWAAGVVRADIPAMPEEPPPQEKVLCGTLSWENVKQPDGSTVKGNLLLNAGDRKIVLPLASSGTGPRSTKAGETIDVTAFVGRQVKVTAKVIELNRRNPRTVVLSVTRIEEAPASVAQSKAEGEQQPADPRRK